jgi:2,3-bisphosphoglycerate-independent phosphoglycerate mutase
MSRGGGVLFVFLDGVGIGTDDEGRNPFALAWARALVPTLQELVGGTSPTLDTPHLRGPQGRAFPLDATLGVDGTPQSGTGQAALLTGVNAAKEYGRHFGPWTPVKLRPLVEEQSLLRMAQDDGHRVVFANAYPRGWPGSRGRRRVAGPPLAARGAGLLDRHEEALGRGDAVTSEIVNDGWQRHLGHSFLPDVTPEQAGANLARIAAQADLTLYAHYSTDTVGHRGTMDEAVEALETVDGFLGGILAELPADHSLLVASDHGNIEDMPVGHTRNPALGIAAGPAADGWAEELESILDVTPAILRHLGG